MKRIFFVRHAQPDYTHKEDASRPLTEKGMRDSYMLADFLQSKKIGAVYSSPYKRCVDTVRPFAEKVNLPITVANEFRERKIDDEWIEDFSSFAKRQWEDFSFKLAGGECLAEVQQRNVERLALLLQEEAAENIVIGTHGTALATILHYFDPAFGEEGFQNLRPLTPCVVRVNFSEQGAYAGREVEFFIPPAESP